MENETSNAITKAFDILELFLNKANDEIGISEMAQLSGLKVSTAHRIAVLLVEKGYLTQSGKRGKYSLGLKFIEFGSALERTMKIRDIAFPHLEKLRVSSGEACNLAIRDKNEVVYIEHFECNQTLRTFTEVGNRAPMYCTGVGKLFLAQMSEEDRRAHFQKPRIRYTDNTLTDQSDLEKEISIIQGEGVALDNGEMDIGVRCIAAPVKDAKNNIIAAISVSGPFTRLNSKRIEELKPLVKNCGLEISRAFGYR
jgi:IclR family transcriptional regulator, KDG regulon repressor